MSFGMEWMRNRHLVMMRSGHATLEERFDMAIAFDRWIAVKVLLEFPDALFYGVDEESILGDDEVWSRQA